MKSRGLTAGEERTGRTSRCQFAKRLQTVRLMTSRIAWEDSELLHHRILFVYYSIIHYCNDFPFDHDDDRIVLAVRCMGGMARSVVVVDVTCYL